MNLSPASRRWLIRCAKLALVAGLVWAAHATLQRALADLENPDYREHLPRLQPAWLALAGLLFLAAMIPSSLFYARLLAACKQPMGIGAAACAALISQVGKYVPGKGMVLVLRAELLAGRGVERTVSVAAAFIETFTAMACGALVGAVAFAPSAAQRPEAIPAALVMFAIAAPLAFPALFARIANLLGMRRLNPAAADKLVAVGWRTLAFGWCAAAVGWSLQGLCLWAALRAIGQGPTDPLAAWPLHIAAMSLSVVAGFFTMIPGGLGSRDVVLTQLLAPTYGAAPAALAAIFLRLISLVSEALVSTILYGAHVYLSGRRAAAPRQPGAKPQ